jgi:hypothetical protein
MRASALQHSLFAPSRRYKLKKKQRQKFAPQGVESTDQRIPSGTVSYSTGEAGMLVVAHPVTRAQQSSAAMSSSINSVFKS